MNKWYRKPVTKAILVVLAILSAASMVMNVLVISAFSGNIFQQNFWESTKLPYEESADFYAAVENAMYTVLEQQHWRKNLETDGKYDENKLVDIIEYGQKDTVSGENLSGLAYRLGDLDQWGEIFDSGEELYTNTGVIVCENLDGTYHYYYQEEFFDMLEEGTLSIDIEEENRNDFLAALKNGYYTSTGYYDYSLKVENKEGETVYTDCWNFDASLIEEYAPEGAENLLEVVNSIPELNGKLLEIYHYLDKAIYSLHNAALLYQDGAETYGEGNTNFTYIYADLDSKQIYTNKAEYQDFDKAEENINQMIADKNDKYIIIFPKLKDFKTNMDIAASTYKDMVNNYIGGTNKNIVFAACVDTDFPIQDVFYTSKETYDRNLPYLRNSALVGSASAVLFFILIIWLTLVTGRRAEDEEIHLNGFDRWKTEIAAALIIGIWLGFTAFLSMNWTGVTTEYNGANLYDAMQYVYFGGLSTAYISITDIIALCVYGLLTGICFFAGYLSLVKRIKAGTLWKNSLLCAVGRFAGVTWRNRTVTFQGIAALIGIFVIHWMCLVTGWHIICVIPAILADIGVIYVVISNAIAKSRIKKGIEQIASGDLNYRIELKGLRGTNLEMAEKVNNIGNGLNRAVEENMKSERLKTDLITNVSHDIKTPLTSIINYVDLLKRENLQDEKIQGYLAILEAKAQRLKTLTEDVVEASKVSSGNIKLEFMNVNLVEMIQQTEGEFEEKFSARDLSVITSLPEQEAIIHVDGRRLWRVLENIYGNAAKYAMPGTRVYADLKVEDETVRFSLKNISEQQLNISADELTERFIRGDISRSTEGSGLGLSIAQSLMKMQGGVMELYLDGDLFKVELEFPRVKEK